MLHQLPLPMSHPSVASTDATTADSWRLVPSADVTTTTYTDATALVASTDATAVSALYRCHSSVLYRWHSS